jgi:large subunit ribosomal protein L10
LNKAQKKELIDELHGKFQKAKAAILTDYKGLSVAEITALRNELRKSSLDYKVVKNTLAIRASEGTDAEKLKGYFEGPTGLVLGYGDAVSPAKVIIEYAKKLGKLQVRVGLIEGLVADAEMLKAIAALPSREELLSRMAAGFQAPASQMARLLAATVARMGYALTALKDQKEKQA